MLPLVTSESYARRTERPLLVLALLFLIVISLPVIEPDLRHGATVALRLANILIWAAFAVDYLVRLVLADRRWHFVRSHPLDLAAVALPALRPLRLLRLFSIGSMLAARSRRSLATQAIRLVGASAALLVFVAAVAALSVERDAEGSNIGDIGDALWWASTTITTVGYGDRFPVTTEGRLIGVALMALGIALVGVLTASIAAWFVAQVRASEEEIIDPVHERLDLLEAKIDELLEAQKS